MTTEGPGRRSRHKPHDPLSLDATAYAALRAIAARAMRQERNQTLNPTELVHEAWLKLARGRPRDYADRIHFLATAALAMRQVLVDRARTRATARRGGGAVRVTLVDHVPGHEPSENVLALHAALEALEAEDADAAQVVVYRYFGGLTEVEIGTLMRRSERWVRGQWTYARAWLRRELDGGQ